MSEARDYWLGSPVFDGPVPDLSADQNIPTRYRRTTYRLDGGQWRPVSRVWGFQLAALWRFDRPTELGDPRMAVLIESLPAIRRNT